MALPIKETPVLLGKDAKEFVKRMQDASEEAVSKEEYTRAEKIYQEFVKKQSQPV